VIRPHTATIYTLSLHDALPIFFVLALDLATAGFVLGELLFGARITMLVLLEDVEALLRLVLLDLLRHRDRSSCANKKIRRKSGRSEEHTSELQSRFDLVCRLLL